MMPGRPREKPRGLQGAPGSHWGTKGSLGRPGAPWLSPGFPWSFLGASLTLEKYEKLQYSQPRNIDPHLALGEV